MLKLIKIEFYKIFKKPRTYIGFAALAFIVIAAQVGFYFQGEQLLDFLIQNIKDKFSFEGKLINAYTVTYVLMNSVWIYLPLLAALVVGDLLAGESNSGTFRMILTRPVSRTKLLTAKLLAGFIYAVSLVIFLMILSLTLGLLLFGPGDLIVVRSSIDIFSADDVLWRFGYSFVYSILTMLVITSLALFLSAFSDNSVGPIVGTFAIVIGITIVSTLGYALLKPILPYLFTTYLRSWNLFFEMEMNTDKLIRGIIVNIAYTITFLSITYYYFKNKDILS